MKKFIVIVILLCIVTAFGAVLYPLPSVGDIDTWGTDLNNYLNAVKDGFNVLEYGAVEDGVTDNTVAIQDAIDAAEQSAVVNKARGVVVFPTVTGLGYKCDSDIQLKDQVRLTGGMIEFGTTAGFESNGKSGWIIDNMTINGSGAAGQVGIYSHNNSVKWWVHHCQFYSVQTGIFATKSFIFYINNNDFWLFTMDNIVCIKLTSGEGNCSKGTSFATVNAVQIRDNTFKEASGATSPNPLIHIGDSTLAPIDPKEVLHAKGIHIVGNQFNGQKSETAVKLENTRMVTIEQNWFETFKKAAVHLSGQFQDIVVIRANGFFGNNDDDSMDPALKIDTSVAFDIFNVSIVNNKFSDIHTNHNFIEAENVVGFVIGGSSELEADRITLSSITGLDIRHPQWNFIYDTFTAADATPTVKFRRLFLTDSGALTITAFDDGIVGQLITVESTGAVVYDTTTANDATHNLDGSSEDITTVDGDITRWQYNGTAWTLISFIDISADNSGGI